MNKAALCNDLGELPSASAGTASCRAMQEDLTQGQKADVDCVLNCWANAPSCTEYFDLAYFSCTCENQCGVDCG